MPASPLIPGFSPDPSVCRGGDEYVVATSTMEYFPAIALHASRDRRRWEPIGHAIDRPGQLDLSGAADSHGIWAPTIRHHDGTWYLTATLMSDGDGPRGNFYLTASDPRGDWSDPVWVPDAEGIDPSLFFHEGRVWWLGNRHPAQPEWPDQVEIWMRELDLDAGALTGPTHVLWSGAARGAKWTEAPHLHVHDGRFVLLTAEGGTGREHAVVVARSDSLLGPYSGHQRNPVLTHRHLGERHPVQNVGHADLVDDGSWAVVLASRTIEGHHLLGRETFGVDVVWEDGWPVFAPGVGRIPDGTRVARSSQWEAPATLAGWSAVRGAPTFAREVPLGLEITAGDSPVALLRPLRSTAVRIGVVLVPAPQHATGLVLRQDSSNSVRIEVSGDHASVVVRERGVESTVAGAALTRLPGDTVALVADIDGLSAQLSVDGAALHDLDLRFLSTESVGGYGGVVFGPFVGASAASSSTLATAWYHLTR